MKIISAILIALGFVFLMISIILFFTWGKIDIPAENLQTLFQFTILLFISGAVLYYRDKP